MKLTLKSVKKNKLYSLYITANVGCVRNNGRVVRRVASLREATRPPKHAFFIYLKAPQRGGGESTRPTWPSGATTPPSSRLRLAFHSHATHHFFTEKAVNFLKTGCNKQELAVQQLPLRYSQ